MSHTVCKATQYQRGQAKVLWSTAAPKICEWINEEELTKPGKNKHYSQAYWIMGCPGISLEELDGVGGGRGYSCE
jgi:hypothetical protein